MNETYKSSAVALGGVLIFGLMVFSIPGSSNGQVIKIADDGVNPVERQIVTITTTKPVETVDFSGTLDDLKNGKRVELLREIDTKKQELAKVDQLIATIEAELARLPARSEPPADTQPNEPGEEQPPQ